MEDPFIKFVEKTLKGKSKDDQIKLLKSRLIGYRDISKRALDGWSKTLAELKIQNKINLGYIIFYFLLIFGMAWGIILLDAIW